MCDGWTYAVGRSIAVVIALGGDAPVLLDIVTAEQDMKTSRYFSLTQTCHMHTIRARAHNQSMCTRSEHVHTIRSCAHSTARAHNHCMCTQS